MKVSSLLAMILAGTSVLPGVLLDNNNNNHYYYNSPLPFRCSIFWHPSFSWICRLHVHAVRVSYMFALKMEAVHSAEAPVYFYQTAQYHPALTSRATVWSRIVRVLFVLFDISSALKRETGGNFETSLVTPASLYAPVSGLLAIFVNFLLQDSSCV